MAQSIGRGGCVSSLFFALLLAALLVLAFPPSAASQAPAEGRSPVTLEAELGIHGLYRSTWYDEPSFLPLTVKATGLPSGFTGTVRATFLECKGG